IRCASNCCAISRTVVAESAVSDLKFGSQVYARLHCATAAEQVCEDMSTNFALFSMSDCISTTNRLSTASCFLTVVAFTAATVTGSTSFSRNGTVVVVTLKASSVGGTVLVSVGTAVVTSESACTGANVVVTTRSSSAKS